MKSALATPICCKQDIIHEPVAQAAAAHLRLVALADVLAVGEESLSVAAVGVRTPALLRPLQSRVGEVLRLAEAQAIGNASAKLKSTEAANK